MNIDLNDFPGNSNKSKQEKIEQTSQSEEQVKEIKSYDQAAAHGKKVVKGKVLTKKKSAARMAAETFLMKDLEMVKSHMVEDVIMPNLYIGLSDIFHGLIDIIFSNTIAGGLNRNGKKKPIEYDKASWRRDYGRAAGIGKVSDQGNQPLKAKRKGREIDEFYLESKEDVLAVLDDLRWRISEYGEATVYDLYDAVGKSTDYTEQSWGWTNLDDADAVRVRGGSYLLRLPKPKHLK